MSPRRTFDLEEIIARDPQLHAIVSRNLPNSYPFDTQDVVSGYMIKAMEMATDQGVDAKEFIEEYCRGVNVNLENMQSALGNTQAWVNRWIYRSFMGCVQEVLGLSDSDFFREVSARNFSDVEGDFKMRMAKFFDLGLVLEAMGKQNKEYNSLTEVEVEKDGKGHVIITRRSILKHKTELEELLGQEGARQVLQADCELTQTAYMTLFGVYNDPDARLHDHEVCEGKGDETCVYSVTYSDVSVLRGLANTLLWYTSKIIPPLHAQLVEREELRSELFLARGLIMEGRAESDKLRRRLEDAQEGILRAQGHDWANIVPGYKGSQLESYTGIATEHVMALEAISRDKPQEAYWGKITERLARELKLKALLKGEDMDRNRLFRQVRRLFQPSVAYEEDVEQMQANMQEKAIENKRTYETILAQTLDQFEGQITDQAHRAFLRVNPFDNIENFWRSSMFANRVVRETRGLKETINRAAQAIEIPIEEILKNALRDANEAKSTDIQATYNIETELSVVQPLLFQQNLRDLLFNVIDYGRSVDRSARGLSEVDFYVGTADTAARTRLGLVYEHANQLPLLVLRVEDFGAGMEEGQIEKANEYFSGKSREAPESSKGESGGQGTHDLHDYLHKSAQDGVDMYCVVSRASVGTRVEFFVEEK